MTTVMNSVQPAAPSEGAERILQSERIGTLRHFGRWIDVAGICAAALAALAFWPETAHARVVAWLIWICAVSGLRLAMSWTYGWFVLTEPGRKTWQDLFLLVSVGLGFLWGMGGWIFFKPDSTVHQIALTALLATMALLPAIVLSTHRIVYLSYLAAVFTPVIMRLLIAFDYEGILITLLSLTMVTVFWLLADEGGREILANLRYRLAYREVRGRLSDEVSTRTRIEARFHGEEDRTRHRESKLLEIATDARVTGGNLRAACELMSEHSMRATGCSRVSIWFMSKNETLLRCVHAYENGKHTTRVFLDIDRDDAKKIFGELGHTRGLAIRDVRHSAFVSAAWQNYFTAHGTAGALFVPFRDHPAVMGVILHEWNIGNRESMPGDMAFASALADSMSVAIHAAQRNAAEEEMRRLATLDQLTHLPNRTAFIDRLNQAIARAARRHEPLALLFVDVDRFKTINDSLGHDVGDQVLQVIGQRLQKCVRAGDVVARLGGDEFMVLMEGCDNPKAVTFTAERIVASLSSPVKAGGVDLYPGCSVGISMYPQDGVDQAGLLKSADMAMYRAKERGRNRFEFFTSDLQVAASLRMSHENALRGALERHEFVLHYQPQFDALKGGIYGVEALLRWEHPTQGTIPPAQFIPLAEEMGLIVPLGEWALREACRQMKAWQDATGNRRLQVSVNLSVRQFSFGSLVEMVKNALAASGLPPATLKLEITESALMSDIENNLQLLADLKLLGIRIALDDFGKEHSSMTYLKRLPIDVIKIDRDFVRGTTENSFDPAIIHCLLALADRLRIKAVAEGVETPAQLAFLKKEGCRYMQGYLFSPPLPANECGRLLTRELDLAV
ncbi:MAG: putative bifunctional diguanylate cyclase/phosphodiesterase [Bacillota bacterium]